MLYPLGYEPLLNSHYEVVEKWIVVGNCVKRKQTQKHRKRKQKTQFPSAFCILLPYILSSETPTSRIGLQTTEQNTNNVLLICSDCFLFNVHLFFCWWFSYFTLYYERSIYILLYVLYSRLVFWMRLTPLLLLPYLIYDGASTITESDKEVTEIIMIH